MQAWRNVLARIAAWRRDRLENSRNLAEEIDTFRVCLYSLYYQRQRLQKQQHQQQQPLESSTNETTFKWTDRLNVFDRNGTIDQDKVAQLRFAEQQLVIDMHLEQQVPRLMRRALELRDFDPYPSVITPTGRMHPKSLPHPSYPKTQDSLAYDRLHEHTQLSITNEELQLEDKPIEHPDGFTLKITRSLIDHPLAGFGVLLEGQCQPGAVVAIYPGTLYYPWYTRDKSLHPILMDNEYLISRFDGIVIDGKQWPRQAVMQRQHKRLLDFIGIGGSAKSSELPEQELLRYRNPFAIANYVNHPPPDKQANCIAFAYTFTEKNTAPELRPYVPHKYHGAGGYLVGSDDALAKSLVLVATRPINNEELLLNYRLNPAKPYPSWYTQPDPEEAARRWTRFRAFL